MPTARQAHDIAEDLLDRTGRAMDNGDFEAFESCFSRPVVMDTLEEKLLLQTREDVRRTFDAVRRFRAQNGVIKALRENVSAEFVDPQTIATTHVTRMLTAQNAILGQPYIAHSLLRNVNGTWQFNFCQYAVDDLPQLNAALATHKTKDAASKAASSNVPTRLKA